MRIGSSIWSSSPVCSSAASSSKPASSSSSVSWASTSSMSSSGRSAVSASTALRLGQFVRARQRPRRPRSGGPGRRPFAMGLFGSQRLGRGFRHGRFLATRETGRQRLEQTAARPGKQFGCQNPGRPASVAVTPFDTTTYSFSMRVSHGRFAPAGRGFGSSWRCPARCDCESSRRPGRQRRIPFRSSPSPSGRGPG